MPASPSRVNVRRGRLRLAHATHAWMSLCGTCTRIVVSDQSQGPLRARRNARFGRNLGTDHSCRSATSWIDAGGRAARGNVTGADAARIRKRAPSRRLHKKADPPVAHRRVGCAAAASRPGSRQFRSPDRRAPVFHPSAASNPARGGVAPPGPCAHPAHECVEARETTGRCKCLRPRARDR